MPQKVKYWLKFSSLNHQVAELDEHGQFAVPPGQSVVFMIQTPFFRGFQDRVSHNNYHGTEPLIVKVPERCIYVERDC